MGRDAERGSERARMRDSEGSRLDRKRREKVPGESESGSGDGAGKLVCGEVLVLVDGVVMVLVGGESWCRAGCRREPDKWERSSIERSPSTMPTRIQHLKGRFCNKIG